MCNKCKEHNDATKMNNFLKEMEEKIQEMYNKEYPKELLEELENANLSEFKSDEDFKNYLKDLKEAEQRLIDTDPNTMRVAIESTQKAWKSYISCKNELLRLIAVNNKETNKQGTDKDVECKCCKSDDSYTYTIRIINKRTIPEVRIADNGLYDMFTDLFRYI